MALGIAIVTHANIGTTPITSPAYVLSLAFPLPLRDYDDSYKHGFFISPAAHIKTSIPAATVVTTWIPSL